MNRGHSSRPPSLLRNPLSLFGLGVALLATSFGLPMMFVDMLSPRTPAYLGVLIYLVLPMTAGGGAVLALLGAAWEQRRRALRPGVPLSPFPRIDLNEPRTQAAIFAVSGVVLVVVVLLSVTGYRAYHFTESTEFCGVVCHQVMKPEFTAYKHSPHARVACTACHVGPGASWYVRSKFSGLYQVVAVAANRYPRPLSTPIRDLRPAQETCEQCHWPEKFFGSKQKTYAHTLSDEQNSPWQVQMLIRVGGGGHETGAAAGIHWHMNIEKEIEYIAADPRREVIPWVRAVDREGRATEYVSTDNPLTPEQVARAEIRRMDCMDCHNRPAHIFRSPAAVVEEALETGRLDRSLPYLKREAVQLLSERYATGGKAATAVAEGISRFYRETYPDLYQRKLDQIQQAAVELGAISGRVLFPEMGADWRVYPDHSGHMSSDGCFRCHDGLHRSADGKVITNDCSTCHTILAQGSLEEIRRAGGLKEQPFRHPVDMGTDVTRFKCSQCHNDAGGN